MEPQNQVLQCATDITGFSLPTRLGTFVFSPVALPPFHWHAFEVPPDRSHSEAERRHTGTATFGRFHGGYFEINVG